MPVNSFPSLGQPAGLNYSQPYSINVNTLVGTTPYQKNGTIKFVCNEVDKNIYSNTKISNDNNYKITAYNYSGTFGKSWNPNAYYLCTAPTIPLRESYLPLPAKSVAQYSIEANKRGVTPFYSPKYFACVNPGDADSGYTDNVIIGKRGAPILYCKPQTTGIYISDTSRITI